MSARERREQLIVIGRRLFAEKGYEATSVEEISAAAAVSKPVVYEHFGGKEGLYAVVVDREMADLHSMITDALSMESKRYSSRMRIQRAAVALLTFVEDHTEGFRILVRDSPVAAGTGTYSTMLNEAIGQVTYLLAGQFSRRGFRTELAELYGQALVGTVSLTAQWWLDVRTPGKEAVAAHIVNLCWNGLSNLEIDPALVDTEGIGAAVPAPVAAGEPEA